MQRHRLHTASRNRGRQNAAAASNSGPRDEEGIIIVLVAIFMLFVVGAMAALSIDITTFYTARSEAQIAADGAALAGARVLANSGMTSDPNAATDGLLTSAWTLAAQVATQVAQSNQVGGRPLTAAEVSVPTSPSNCGAAPVRNNPCITVRVSRSDLPTFFARIWGRTQISVSASATAEAYNPSGLANIAASPVAPVAPICVKPWLLQNQPTGGPTIFTNVATGEANPALLGMQISGLTDGAVLGPGPQNLSAWQYLPGDTDSSFPPPSASSVACNGSAGFDAFQLSIAGCVQMPIACNNSVNYVSDPSRDPDTIAAVNCLTHATAAATGGGDSVTAGSLPFEFLAGEDNPLVQAGTLASGTNLLVSDSLVTVPVYGSAANNSANIVGFVQLFLNSGGTGAPAGGPITSVITNLVGCSTNATGTPIYGNGPSAVAVRLVTPQ